ncbi:MAG: energy transducer TonB [Terracidiphilus sp.]|jgi:TonB family protein
MFLLAGSTAKAQAVPPESAKLESPTAKADAETPRSSSVGFEILSDTQGVDFSGWLKSLRKETEKTWGPLIPNEVNPPRLKSGQVIIRFKVRPKGKLKDGSMILEGSSGDTAMDRAAWVALVGSKYPPLPEELHGPYLEVRACFLYNRARILHNAEPR